MARTTFEALRPEVYTRSRSLYVLAAAAVCLVVPLAFGAAILYPQPSERIAQIGKMCHVLSLVMAWLGVAYFARNNPIKIGLLLGLPIAFGLSSFEVMRTLYLVLITMMFGLSGLIVTKRFRQYLLFFIVVLGSVSLILMALQVYGWPSWINNLATQGAFDNFGVRYKLQPTFLVNAKDLKAVYWQARPAGVFASNQANTLFFFLLFATALSWRGRVSYPLLVVSAAYAALVLSKAAILGSLVILVVLSCAVGRMYIAVGACYFLAEALLLALYYVLFPGVIDTYFSPYDFVISIAARVIDLSGAIRLDLVRSVGSALQSHWGAGSVAFNDALAAFRAPNGALQYDNLGSTMLYSEIARAPVTSGLIIAALVAIGAYLRGAFKDSAWRRPQPFEIVVLLGMFIVTWVMAVGEFHIFWLCTAFGLLPLYEKLIEPERPLSGPATQPAADRLDGVYSCAPDVFALDS